MFQIQTVAVGLIVICLSGCTVSQKEIVTIPLHDAVIYAAKEAAKSGAKTFAYEANVVNTSEASGSVVVPILPITATLGGKLTTQVGAKITIQGEVQPIAKETPSGQKFLLDTTTLKTTPIQ